MPNRSKKNTETDLNLVQLNKNNKFVAKGLPTTYSSKIKITPDGQRIVKSVHSIQERHLKADPKLPTLQERASMSSNKDLYNLSQQLAEETEGKPKESKVYFDNNPQQKTKNEDTKAPMNAENNTDKCRENEESKKKILKKRKSGTSSVQENLTQQNVGDYIKKEVRSMTLKRLAEHHQPTCEISKVLSNNAATVLPRMKVKEFVDKGNDPITDFEFLQSFGSDKSESSASSYSRIRNKIGKTLQAARHSLRIVPQ